MEDKPCCKV